MFWDYTTHPRNIIHCIVIGLTGPFDLVCNDYTLARVSDLSGAGRVHIDRDKTITTVVF